MACPFLEAFLRELNRRIDFTGPLGAEYHDRYYELLRAATLGEVNTKITLARADHVVRLLFEQDWARRVGIDNTKPLHDLLHACKVLLEDASLDSLEHLIVRDRSAAAGTMQWGRDQLRDRLSFTIPALYALVAAQNTSHVGQHQLREVGTHAAAWALSFGGSTEECLKLAGRLLENDKQRS